MIKRIIVTIFACALTSCATLERHPAVTAAALAFVGASIALSVNAGEQAPVRRFHDPQMRQ